MAQETQSQSASLTGSLDDTGDIGHDKRLLAAIRHDAQIGLQSRERIVGNLGLSGADDAEQGGFSRIRKAHKAYIGQQFQLQDDRFLDTLLARLGKTRRLAGSGLEVLIAQTTTSTTQQAHDLSILGHVTQELPRLGIIYRRSARHLDGAVLAVLTRALVLATRLAVGGKHMTLVLQVDECPQVAVTLQVDVATTAAVTAVRTTLGDILGAVQMGRTGATLATAAHDLHIVDKIALCHKSLVFVCCKGKTF